MVEQKEMNIACCAVCGCVLSYSTEKDRIAAEKYKKTFEAKDTSDASPVCDKCYKEVMKFIRTKAN